MFAVEGLPKWRATLKYGSGYSRFDVHSRYLQPTGRLIVASSHILDRSFFGEVEGSEQLRLLAIQTMYFFCAPLPWHQSYPWFIIIIVIRYIYSTNVSRPHSWIKRRLKPFPLLLLFICLLPLFFPSHKFLYHSLGCARSHGRRYCVILSSLLSSLREGYTLEKPLEGSWPPRLWG